MSIPQYIHADQHIKIQHWGMIDDLILYPEDILILGDVSDGDY